MLVLKGLELPSLFHSYVRIVVFVFVLFVSVFVVIPLLLLGFFLLLRLLRLALENTEEKMMLFLKGLEITLFFRWYFRIAVFVFAVLVAVVVVVVAFDFSLIFSHRRLCLRCVRLRLRPHLPPPPPPLSSPSSPSCFGKHKEKTMLVLKGLELTSLFRSYFRIVVFVFVLFVSVFVVIPLLLGCFLLLRLHHLAVATTEERVLLLL